MYPSIRQRGAQKYPRDPSPLSLLSGFTAEGTGKYENGMDAAKRSIQLDPTNAIAYVNLADNCIRIDRLDEAETTIRQAIATRLNRARPLPAVSIHRLPPRRSKDDGAGRSRQGSCDRRPRLVRVSGIIDTRISRPAS